MSRGPTLSLVTYFGGKTEMLDVLHGLSYHPCEWSCTELFGGGGCFLLSRWRVPMEVYNDIDGSLVLLARVVRERWYDLAEYLSWVLVGPDEYDWARGVVSEARQRHGRLSGLDVWGREALRIAAAKIVSHDLGFNSGVGAGRSVAGVRQPSYGRRGDRRSASFGRVRWSFEALRRLGERLRRMYIANWDWRYFMEKLAGVCDAGVLLYCDPPYLADVRHEKDTFYSHEMLSRSEHEELLRALCGLGVRVMLSGYRNELYDGFLCEQSGWWRVDVAVKTRCGNRYRTQARRSVESVWLNFRPVMAEWQLLRPGYRFMYGKELLHVHEGSRDVIAEHGVAEVLQGAGGLRPKDFLKLCVGDDVWGPLDDDEAVGIDEVAHLRPSACIAGMPVQRAFSFAPAALVDREAAEGQQQQFFGEFASPTEFSEA